MVLNIHFFHIRTTSPRRRKVRVIWNALAGIPHSAPLRLLPKTQPLRWVVFWIWVITVGQPPIYVTTHLRPAWLTGTVIILPAPYFVKSCRPAGAAFVML